ncbi:MULTISPECIES: aldehyde dehydrogenase [Serratia]|uniref:aldehyde dehydrogenase n=1 Tax=Serratia TaxID=613 RepID=UPI0006691269|nr:aldehyde dehydrogenase [Serratia marcescens]NRN17675.1 aldehyde dehydrogenase [Serratia marcescens]NRN22757.1 aldehyde dehydrogenase [Serratia marcescens]NRN55124.1 aldehyde dehydrogenase [Serratia marcescens]CVD50905.1 Aldehyde dehydrogenase PuuC [Serratia marcescens]CVF13596.1 Aldehyde dehydrogenase PuuC [Serratia marcescens]
MKQLQTLNDVTRLAHELTLPDKAFINGRFAPARSGKTLTTYNPATGEAIVNLAACDESDVNAAVSTARTAFEAGSWSKLAPGERKAVLLKLAALMEQQLASLAVLESLDSGKPVSECLAVDVPETIHVLKWHAEAIDKLYDHTAPVGNNAMALIVREPIGVVGCVLPWNFPLLMLAWKIGPALAAGCSVVVKPAEQTSLTSLRVAELAFEAGVPGGVLNIVTGTGKEVGEPIGLHPDIDMVSFTGSTATGRRFLHYAAESNLKKVVLECGGKNPALVFNDADDIAAVAEHVLNGAFWNMGENCSATSRLLVQEDVKEALLAEMAKQIGNWTMGNPFDPRNRLGAMISPEHFSKVSCYLDIARQEGLPILHGGNTKQGAYVQPTIIDGVTPESALFREEIFGPVLCVTTFKTEAEAIALANDTPYGLAASVYTGKLNRAIRVSRAIRAGTVTVNCFGEGDATTPFGGYRQSGFGGRDKSVFALDQYTELKTIWVDVAEDDA